MERKLHHAVLDTDVARSILALSRNHGGGGGAYLHEDRNRVPPVVFEFDASRAQRFNYLVNQLKHPSSSMENLITIQAFMAEFGDSFRGDSAPHHHPAVQTPQSLFNGHSAANHTANPAGNNSTGDSDISYTSSDLSEPGLGFIQNMFDNNFATADDHGVHGATMQNYATNHPLYGNRIHKPQPRKAAGNGPSTTNPNMPHPNGRGGTSQYFNSPTYMQQQKAAGVVAAMAAAQSATTNALSNSPSKQPRSNPVAHKSNGNSTPNGPALTKARVEPQFLSEEEKAKRDLTRERNNKYREKKMVENPFDYRRKKAEAQKRYMEKLKTQNPEIYRRRKVEYQKRYMDKKTSKNAGPYFYSL